jgi:hypothetical protein
MTPAGILLTKPMISNQYFSGKDACQQGNYQGNFKISAPPGPANVHSFSDFNAFDTIPEEPASKKFPPANKEVLARNRQ